MVGGNEAYISGVSHSQPGAITARFVTDQI